jgi:hypothetical protein
MTLTGLREYGLTLLAEERTILFRIAMGTATDADQKRYDELTGIISEIEARLYRAHGDGAGLTPVAM